MKYSIYLKKKEMKYKTFSIVLNQKFKLFRMKQLIVGCKDWCLEIHTQFSNVFYF